MPITVTCQCGAVYRVADQYAGKRTRCKKCNAIMEIPAPVVEPVAVEQVEEPAEPVMPPAPQEDAQAEWPQGETAVEPQTQWPEGPAEIDEQAAPAPISYRSAPVGASKSSRSPIIIAVAVGAVVVALGMVGIFFFRSASAPVKMAPPVLAPVTPGSSKVTTPGGGTAADTTGTGSNLAQYNQALAQAVENRKRVLEMLKQPKPDFKTIDALDDIHQKAKRTMLNLSVELTSEETASIDADQKKSLGDLEFEVTTTRAQITRPDMPDNPTPANTQPTTPAPGQ